MEERIQQQLDFIVEVDKLKSIFRRTYIIDGSRRENDAEHSWHLALMAIILSEYANHDMDVLRVMKMVVIHDLIEIDAGDTFAYDVKGHEDKLEREIQAAERLFNLLPEDQAASIRALWDEFEERKTQEAKFAVALDRLQPVLLNFFQGGKAWKENGITKSQVLNRNKQTVQGSKAIWEFIQYIIDKAVDKGYLKED